jgi:hypothetical protein
MPATLLAFFPRHGVGGNVPAFPDIYVGEAISFYLSVLPFHCGFYAFFPGPVAVFLMAINHKVFSHAGFISCILSFRL